MNAVSVRGAIDAGRRVEIVEVRDDIVLVRPYAGA
jgi:membrane-bound ClpP family serine protease